MNHFIVSIVKSIIRIVACIVAIMYTSLFLFALGFLVAEILGILEEVFDKRKEE